MAKMSPKMLKGYKAYEKAEPKSEKKKEAKAGMHMMNGKAMKNSAMKGKTKKMGKKK
jgi:hypothetical protein